MTAIWTAPRTFIAGELLTASIFNTYVRDEFDWLKTPIASKVTTGTITTSSASYVDVTNMTATFTTNGGGVDVLIRCTLNQTGAATNTVQLVVDGASECILGTWTSPGVSNIPVSLVHHIAALSAGSHTIKVQVKTNASSLSVIGTGAGTGDSLLYVIERGG